MQLVPNLRILPLRGTLDEELNGAFDKVLRKVLTGPLFLTIGNFDGVHRGHQALFQRLRAFAADYSPQAKTAFLTFDPHPLAILRPDRELKLLTTPAERIALAAESGINYGIIQAFSSDFAQQSPAQFLQQLKDSLGMVGLVVGPDFALGRNRSGDLATLTELGKTLGYELHIVEPVDWHDRPVRSSIIRSLLEMGDVADAAELLGRRYHVTGTVITGDKRGRTIGFPTANLQPPANKLLPGNGVYATWTSLLDVEGVPVFPSVTNIGVRPTVDGVHLRVEPHLIDFPVDGIADDLYGQSIRLEFVTRLRGEQRFVNLQALVEQIGLDVVAARQALAQIE